MASCNPETSTNLKACFLPYLTPSHMIPLVDIALLFAARGVRITFFTTPANTLLFRGSAERAVASGHRFDLHEVPFPSEAVGLPAGVESFSSAGSVEAAGKVFKAFMMLRQPMEQLIRDTRPDFIVADMHCFWAIDIADVLGVPRLVFHGRAFFALSAAASISRHAPHQKAQLEPSEAFVLPELPGEIRMTASELPEWVRFPSGYTTLMNTIAESDEKSYGVIGNSFYEMESEYVDHYRNALGRKAWAIGPPFLLNKKPEDDKATSKDASCLEWLDSQETESVVYVNFGSLSRFGSTQLLHLAAALEASGRPFLWVVHHCGKEGSSAEQKWLPEGYEEGIKEGRIKGMIVRGWISQDLILGHRSVGGFLTHCGWNSVLESVVAGVPMVTWPLSAEHFYNEKLVTHVLRIGVGVGPHPWSQSVEECTSFVSKDMIEKAVRELMGGGEVAEEMRRKAKGLGEAARKAVEEGGSSYADLTSLLAELEEKPKSGM